MDDVLSRLWILVVTMDRIDIPATIWCDRYVIPPGSRMSEC